jgi:hypothetical protein
MAICVLLVCSDDPKTGLTGGEMEKPERGGKDIFLNGENIIVASACAMSLASKSPVSVLWSQPRTRKSICGLFESMGTMEERNYCV